MPESLRVSAVRELNCSHVCTTAMPRYTAKYWRDRFIVHATAGDTGGWPSGHSSFGASMEKAPTHTVVKPPYSIAMSTQRNTPEICATMPGWPVLISGVPSSDTVGVVPRMSWRASMRVPRKSTLSIGAKFTVAQAAVSVDSVLRSGDAVNWLYVRTTATAVY